ncbi:methyl-accepting chemotaxis protein [Paenibacillus sp. 1001270B_150601_E10]|uniref:methyl-accepting chemotaxis protein n=1 Tax=Paenibacillus sp. 1001270B_150601_E10 TaxID=2787079 RepID=UPI00189CBC85|nr:methyl-accepting chemotaxis protein [Paenibacillus sp. 1001270B_150601_E10]
MKQIHKGIDYMVQRSIKTKFITLMLILVFGFTITGAGSYIQSTKLIGGLNELYHEQMQSVVLTEKMMVSFKQASVFLERILETEDASAVSWHRDDYRKQMDQLDKTYAQFLEEHHDQKPQLEEMQTALTSFKNVADRLIESMESNHIQKAKRLYDEEGRSLENVVFRHMEKLEKDNLDQASLMHDKLTNDAGGRRFIIIILYVLLLLLSAGVCYGIMLSIEKPIDALRSLMAQAAAGDLTAESRRFVHHEMGRISTSYNQMLGGLRQLVLHLKGATDQLIDGIGSIAEYTVKSHSASEETVRTMHQAEQGAVKQQQATEETSRAMEEMARGIQDIVYASGAIMEITNEASDHTESGTGQMQQAMNEMEVMNASVQAAVEKVRQLHVHSDSIGKIVLMIKDISSQTNLLAINASIEAARAGEHGRGFSVVADEVRKLAEQSHISTQHIEELIKQIQQDTNQTVEVMKDVHAHVLTGQQAVVSAGDTFMELKQRMKHIVEQMENVSASTEELSAGSEEVAASAGEVSIIASQSSQDIREVTNKTQDQLDAMSMISQTMDELYERVYSLEQYVNQFQMESTTSGDNEQVTPAEGE